MWKCRRCEKPVYFAERKQSMGFDWHPECLRCSECSKRLNPGQHAEHKGAPYCHVPCYGALFGPHLFGHGTHVEAHASFGRRGSESETARELADRQLLERQLKAYNKYHESSRTQIHSRERNGRLILDGVLKLYWGVNKLLQFKEDDDQRPIVRKRMSQFVEPTQRSLDSDSGSDSGSAPATPVSSPAHGHARNQSVTPHALSQLASVTPPPPPEAETNGHVVPEDGVEKGQLEVSEVENCNKEGPSPAAVVDSSPTDESTTEPPLRQPAKSRVIRRRPGRRMNKTKIKRRCSINGHFYNRETSVFTPPHGSGLSVWVTSLVTSREMIDMVLEKYRVEDRADNFALYIVWDSGERRRLRSDEYPLLTRISSGPSEAAARLFIMDRETTAEIRSEVAQYINLTDVECTAILQKYREEEERQLQRIKDKFAEMRERIKSRMRDLKVQL
ncbi:ras association domain-containing protein 4-like [Pollicipes pollicipes]|uniref:ras association domain-containing protein 4-like n=1 Tax=Pollicipes pollicipes TaxID=41117 RepID=UPI0018853941|nr:ras association domain-containing protein 4-like [Pollicipes pollicipes]XP_037083766.1 ras association domain-containing protein 4-like [Pollicipes pollicipes]XP_037083767.1 ras association domain-containing protein 4-like [Pollicipes pollicipes]XP_037084163.1 ras association domain-containing protein 4-like [Pollicipes pollicipes]XP_037084164.1 ras association domain-containing protein 4-like [Pollicipes pollicipes]